MTEKQEIEFYILRVLSEMSIPIGAGTIRNSLNKKEIFRSEPGIGRILRDLKARGFARKEGLQGHCITEKGMEHFLLIKKKRFQSEIAESLVNHINSNEETLIDEILHARRAIQTEAAALAAERATLKDIEMLRVNIEQQKKCAPIGSAKAKLDSEFHLLLIEASGNTLLRSMYELIGINNDLAKFFEKVRVSSGSQLGEDHFEIFEAIENKDVDQAAKLMASHIDNTLGDAKQFFSNIKNKTSREMKA